MAGTRFTEKVYDIEADIYDPKTGHVERRHYDGRGRGSMGTIMRDFQKWCWSQGIVGRIRSVERVTQEEPKRVEFPAG